MPSLLNKIIRIAFRLYPLPNGAGAIVYHLLKSRPFREETLEVNTTYGFPMTVFPNDLIGRTVYFAGQFEPSVIRVICTHCHGDETILDIGANIGTVSCALLRKLPNAHVISVEPNPRVFELLERNVRQIDGERAECLNLGISDKNRIARLVINDTNSGANYILGEPNSTHSPRTVDVELITGSVLLERCMLERLDIIKIDVEGHEAQVLTTLAPLIRLFRPRLILFECFADLSDERHSVRKFFDGIDYDIAAIRKEPMGETIVPVDAPGTGRWWHPCRVDTYLAKPAESSGLQSP